jgi:cytosine/adenosine deaminase-related metal-dependent hydrolase
MSTLIRNVSMLFGEEFQQINNGFITIDNGAITSLGAEEPPTSRQEVEFVMNGSGLLAIPGLIDAHVHMGDSFVKDIGIGSSLKDLVHPIQGLKTKLLKSVGHDQICEAINATSHDMIASGITTFVDFREGGLTGVQLALKALEHNRHRAIILGRPNYHFNEDEVIYEAPLTADIMRELFETIDLCGGVGVSGPNEYTNNAMQQISTLTKGKRKLLATHAAESAETRKFSLEKFSVTEVERALRYLEPDFIVHLTNSTQDDIHKLSDRRIPVVCCPRANAILGVGFPPILELFEAGVTVALGTDNVMLNAPDMFREMDYASRMLRATHRNAGVMNSKAIFKMATLNAACALRLESLLGSIEEGKRADIVFLDLNTENLRFSKDLIASIVHRARPEDIKCVMVDGEVVHGSIPSTDHTSQ